MLAACGKSYVVLDTTAGRKEAPVRLGQVAVASVAEEDPAQSDSGSPRLAQLYFTPIKSPHLKSLPASASAGSDQLPG